LIVNTVKFIFYIFKSLSDLDNDKFREKSNILKDVKSSTSHYNNFCNNISKDATSENNYENIEKKVDDSKKVITNLTNPKRRLDLT